MAVPTVTDPFKNGPFLSDPTELGSEPVIIDLNEKIYNFYKQNI